MPLSMNTVQALENLFTPDKVSMKAVYSYVQNLLEKSSTSTENEDSTLLDLYSLVIKNIQENKHKIQWDIGAAQLYLLFFDSFEEEKSYELLNLIDKVDDLLNTESAASTNHTVFELLNGFFKLKLDISNHRENIVLKISDQTLLMSIRNKYFELLIDHIYNLIEQNKFDYALSYLNRVTAELLISTTSFYDKFDSEKISYLKQHVHEEREASKEYSPNNISLRDIVNKFIQDDLGQGLYLEDFLLSSQSALSPVEIILINTLISLLSEVNSIKARTANFVKGRSHPPQSSESTTSSEDRQIETMRKFFSHILSNVKLYNLNTLKHLDETFLRFQAIAKELMTAKVKPDGLDLDNESLKAISDVLQEWAETLCIDIRYSHMAQNSGIGNIKKLGSLSIFRAPLESKPNSDTSELGNLLSEPNSDTIKPGNLLSNSN